MYLFCILVHDIFSKMLFKVTALPTNDKFGRAITIEREINKECKQLKQKIKLRRLRALILQGAIESNVVIAIW